jgi:hypothetical protein
MAKIMQKSVILSVVFGLLLAAAAAPSAMAQDRSCRRRGFNSSRFNDDFRRDRFRYDDRFRRDYDRQDTTGKAVGRTAAGAGIGALAGALIGGGKGAAVGAAIGGAGGYIFHQQKVNNQNERRRRRW